MKYCICLMIVVLSTTLNARDFGRLFTSPQDRTALDEARRKGVVDKEILAQESPAEISSAPIAIQDDASPPVSPPPFKYNGVVIKNGQINSVWINGKNQRAMNVSEQEVLNKLSNKPNEIPRRTDEKPSSISSTTGMHKNQGVSSISKDNVVEINK